MSDLTPEIAADVVAACQAGAEEAAGALSRTFDAEIGMTIGEAATYSADEPPGGLDGPGLVIKLVIGGEGVAAVLPEPSGLLPEWYTAPDATGESKLATLAQELGMLLLPETLMAEDFQAAASANLKEALAAGGVATGAGLVPLTLAAGESSGVMSLVWPSATPDGLFSLPAEAGSAETGSAETESAETEEAAASDAQPASSVPDAPPAAAAEPAAPAPAPRLLRDFADLPPYAQSLLNVPVPLMVTLAHKRENIEEIIDLGPGSILTFNQPCDGPLTIEVAGQTVAFGEAVKVGEKFGVRVKEMILPGEKFKTVRPAG